jgi:hypothetical protein
MTMRRMMLLAGTATLAAALSQGAAFAYPHHHYYHHHHHHGRDVVRSNPVPDTEHNRDRFGGPMSHGGRSTAPVGN